MILPSLYDLPIGRKLVMISLLAAAAALLLASVGVGVYEYQTARENAVSRLEMLAAVMSANSTAALMFENRDDARSNLTALQPEEQILWACFYDADGGLFAGYSRPDSLSSCPKHGAAEAGHDFRAGHVTVTLPIRLEGRLIGSLIVRAELLALRERLLSYLRVLTLVMLASGGVAFLLASRLQRVISLPILRLVDMSRRVSSEKDYGLRATAGSADEVGLLINSFNEMLEQIQARDRQLERARDRLDQEVKERTIDLEEAVAELRLEVVQRERAEQRIRFLADYDVLTGLANRRLLEERLDKAIAQSGDSGRPAALLFLDLDRFKEINDGFGHSTGDLLLREVGERLLCCVRGSDHVSRPDESVELSQTEATVSRRGGDEFTILLTRLHSPHDATRVAKRILAAMREPFEIGGLELVVGTSIGIAIHPDDGLDSETLIKHADTAMYHVKEAGGGDYQYFTEQMKAAALEKLTIESELRDALAANDLFLLYQPILDLESQRVVGVEALLRWRRPGHGIVPPIDFIPIAEESGLIVPIGEWVLEEACRQCASWRDQGLPPLRVAVNVSSRQLRKGLLVPAIDRALERSGLEASALEVEVTESSMLQNEEAVVEILTEVRERGVQVALDDFGTGYSSLSYLRTLPLDALKIDRSFVTELTPDTESGSIVSAVIAMAQGLGLRVVAEGVETRAQLKRLEGQACNEVQGFLLSEPVKPERMLEVVARIHHEG